MVRNEDEFKQAIEFRKRGFTYSEIARICDVSKATVSNWLKNEGSSVRIKEDNIRKAARDNQKRMQLLNKTRKAERTARYTEAARSAETEYKHYRKDTAFMAGLMLYQAAGDLRDEHKVRLSSNRAEVHRVFIHFAIDYLGVRKQDVQFWLLFTGNVPLERHTRWWSRQIGLPFARFGKPQFVNPNATTLHKGTGNTIIGSTVLKCKLTRWLELAAKEYK